ncbi:MAG: serine/threonine protein kinase [bacterium]|nr:serine/threonine protein kinase [bacterium]
MKDYDLNRVEELFQTAADLPRSEQTAFLKRECGGDTDLQSHVQRLIDRFEDQSSLTSPIGAGNRVSGPFLAATISEGPGAIIDRYKLLQVIGEGGFGVVYMAEQQTPVVRKVALKIIKLGMDTREVVARFEAERQALAMMDHPNIARVLDGGTTDSGRPYFVMELVRGVSITEFCEKNDLTTQRRLELFSNVCQAVQHAHQKGVIHRDLKPSNVMVTLHDGAPMPKVIDFGVAKAMHARLTDKTLFTRYEQFVGTPAYMSPEQAEMSALDIDTRTDIYSLGVLLYEILTGTTPFDNTTLRRAGLAEIQRIIREEQPPRPSLRISATAKLAPERHGGLDPAALRRVLRGDLDWIVMKALEKDRSRRYASAGEFADDIRRHLQSEPVIAGPPGAAYRLRKFLARNRTAAVSSCIVVLALVAGIIGTTASLIEAERNADLAQAQADRALTAVDFLLSTLSLTNPEAALNPNVTVLTLLEHTSARVADAFADDPAAEVRVRATIGRAYAKLGRSELAEPHLRRVVEMVESLGGPDGRTGPLLRAAGFDDVEFHDVLWTLTSVCFNRELPDSFEMAGRALNVGLGHIGETDPDLADLLRRFMETVQSGAWSHTPDAMKGAPELFEQASTEVDAAFSEGDRRWPIVADMMLAAGYTVWYTPHEPLSEVFWRKALEIQRRELPPNHPDTADTVRLLVGILDETGRAEESESLIRESIAALRTVHRDGAMPIALAEGALGRTLTIQGRFDEAEPILLKSHQDILANVPHEANWMALESFMRVVNLYDATQRPEPAEPFRDALARAGASTKYALQWEFLRGAFGPEYGAIVEAADRLQELTGGISFVAAPGTVKVDDLEPAVSEFVDRWFELLDEEQSRSAALAKLLLGYANTLDPVAHRNERCLMAEAARDVLGHWTDRVPVDFAESASVLAGCARAAGDFAQAKRYAQEAWAAAADDRPRGDWMVSSKEVRIARGLLAEGLYEPAEELLRPAHELLQIQLGDGYADTTEARRLLRELYTNWGKPQEAGRYADPPPRDK